MQEFLTNNTVNCNLMSLTGYRTLVILSELMQSPKTNDEINESLMNNQYVKEKFSSDTLRIYINSLRAIGCEITSANKSNTKKYKLVTHPFAYDIPKSQLKALSKLYKSIYDEIDIKEIIDIENFFAKLSNSLKNDQSKEFLKNLSVLKGIDKDILNDLIIHCKNKNQIIILYNSPKSGNKMIEIIADKLSFKSEKLYFWGNNLTHKEYSYFVLDRILKICKIKINKSNEKFMPQKVIYEVYDKNYIPEDDERILESSKNKLLIEASAKNDFSLMQKILNMASDCKVIEPENFKLKLINSLKSMENIYENV